MKRTRAITKTNKGSVKKKPKTKPSSTASVRGRKRASEKTTSKAPKKTTPTTTTRAQPVQAPAPSSRRQLGLPRSARAPSTATTATKSAPSLQRATASRKKLPPSLQVSLPLPSDGDGEDGENGHDDDDNDDELQLPPTSPPAARTRSRSHSGGRGATQGSGSDEGSQSQESQSIPTILRAFSSLPSLINSDEQEPSCPYNGHNMHLTLLPPPPGCGEGRRKNPTSIPLNVRQPVTTIGRAPRNHVQINTTRAVDGISRMHSRIYRDDAGFLVVEDSNSTNGTWVNEEKVSSRRLMVGDKVTFDGPGKTKIGDIRALADAELRYVLGDAAGAGAMVSEAPEDPQGFWGALARFSEIKTIWDLFQDVAGGLVIITSTITAVTKGDDMSEYLDIGLGGWGTPLCTLLLLLVVGFICLVIKSQHDSKKRRNAPGRVHGTNSVASARGAT